MDRKTTIGLLAVLGIWLTAGFALPLVNVLTMFSPEQLLAARGLLAATFALLLVRGRVFGVDKYTLLIGLTVPFASLGLFKGVREWGASPTIIVVTATPIVNFLITALSGKKIPKAAVIGFGLIFGGVVAACWEGSFELTGFLWAAFGTVCNGILYEFFARAKSSPYQKCFWGSFGIGTIGLALSYNADWTQVSTDSRLVWYLIGFAVLHGVLYWVANLVAFENLHKDVASVLAQGETPAVILLAWVLVGEKLTLFQWIGVAVAMFGAWYLMKSLTNGSKTTPVPEPSPA